MKEPLRFSAFAVQMNAGVAGDIEIAIERWSTDAERQITEKNPKVKK